MSSDALSNLSHEERRFPPSPEFAADAQTWVRHALSLVEDQLSEIVANDFYRVFSANGAGPVAEVAAELGMTPNAVHVAQPGQETTP